MKRFVGILISFAMLCQLFVISASAEEDVWYSAADFSEEYCEQSKRTHRDNIPDPGLISDEEYFGEFADGEVIQAGLFNYEKFDGLSAVRDAAMTGDYYQAKQELLKYYRDKFKDHRFYSNPGRDDVRNTRARLLFENNYSTGMGGTPYGIFKVETESSDYQISVLSAISALAGENVSSKKVSFALTGIKKDGMEAVFSSKEDGEHIPYISVVVNDKERIYYPEADTMVIGGDNKSRNYGNRETLEVSESYSSIRTGDSTRTDSYTKRSFLLFDFSDINEGDQVSDADFHIYGYARQSDNPVNPQTDKDFYDVAIYTSPSTDWNEAGMTFGSSANFFSCYDGENLEGLASNTQGPWLLRDIVDEYMYSGNEIFAYHAIRVWMEKIAHAPANAFDGVTLYASLVCSDMLPMLLILLYSEYMTPEYFTAMLKYFYYITDVFCVNDWQNQHEICNFGASNAAGVTAQAMAFNEYRVADEPLEDGGYGNGKRGGWIAVAKHRAYYATYKDIFPDGACTETSTNYTSYIWSLLTKIFTTAEGLNIDVEEWLGPEVILEMRRLCRFLVLATNPQFGDWQQGHAAPYYQKMVFSSEFLDDDIVRYADTNRESATVPEQKSVVWDLARRATLRSDWSENAVAAQINVDGGRNRTHGQNDDLGLNVYGYGSPLLMESTHMDYNYKTPVTGWLLSSKAVNSIEINNVTQKGAYGVNVEALGEAIDTYAFGEPGDMHPENRELNDMYNFLRSETVNYQDHPLLSDSFKLFRDVLFVAPFFIVTDYVEPIRFKDRDNIYKQYWHTLPDAGITMDGDNFRTNFNGANIYVAPVQQEVGLTGQIKEGYWAKGSTYTFADYVRYDKTAKGVTTFNTVLYPMKPSENIDVKTNNIELDVAENTANAFSFETTEKNTGKVTESHYYTLLDESAQAQRSFGKYSTDSKLALITSDNDKNEQAILRNGTNLKDDKRDIILSKSPVSDLGIKWMGDEIRLYTSKGASTNSDYISAASENLALGKRVFNESEDTQEGIENAVDGDMNTYWQSSYSSISPRPVETPWLAVDLGRKEDVSKICITTREKADFYVFSSEDGEYWDYIGVTSGVSGEQYKSTLEFAQQNKRYIKVRSTEALDVAICDIAVTEANSQSVILDNLTVYAPNKINHIYLNDNEIEFSQADNYVYFGDEPIASEKTEPEDPGDKTENIVHGSSGNGGNSNSGATSGEKPDTNTNTPTDADKDLPYQDELRGCWGETEISELVRDKVILGDGETLNLKGKITRAEFMAILTRALSIDVVDYNNEFSDVSADSWYSGVIAAAKKEGLLEGFEGKARPNDTLSREEMAKILMCAAEKYRAGYDETEKVTEFADQDMFSDWAEEYIEKAAKAGLVKGDDNGCFRPSDHVAREEAFVVVYRLIRLKSEE